MSKLIGILLALIKWPLALAVALLTPAAVLTLWDLLKSAHAAKFWQSPFALGFGGMFAFMLIFHRVRFVQFWATLEHEFTHALFAWLTFVRVTDLWTSDGSKVSRERPAVGVVMLEGGNWLISVAPYFFPTAAAALLAATWVLAAVPTTAASVLLGCATAWCVVSTWHETHAGQTDLRTAGLGFSFLFLPGANILCYGLILANELGGPTRAWAYASAVPEVTIGWVRAAM
jgi:hypothetical protein